ncbi:MAG: NTP transferase domain-containing protein [Bacteroidetes bacterium]|nr:NTP transferase domain-containing protein [Bacteroidota bacterium]
MAGAVIDSIINEKSVQFDKKKKNTAIILAAGHGKRIKSNNSKMLHKIWGKPTALRVSEAASKTFNDDCNIIVVVGVKADSVIDCFEGKLPVSFAHQAEQNGTGHAVQMGLKNITDDSYDGNVYVLAGDMGLIDSETILDFKSSFENSDNDMMVLTGIYSGDPMENAYGRIIRVPEEDCNGNSTAREKGNVIGILEYKDILKLDENEDYIADYGTKKYSFSRSNLIANNEFNSGVFVFKYQYLKKLIALIKDNNVQKEVYLTDLISLFNKEGLKVGAVSPKEDYVIMGFNNKSVLYEMNNIARKLIYNKLKDIITIEDPDDFFISDELVNDFLSRDSEGEILDITLGRGSQIGSGVKLGSNIHIGKDVEIEGEVAIGDNVVIGNFSVIKGKKVIADGTEIPPFSVV